jgi:4'-phosphopantetheinyl transferase EntD
VVGARSDGAVDVIAGIVPSSARVAVATSQHRGRPIGPGESRLVARATASRMSSFAVGRACARDALTQLGRPPAEILADERGAPQWPDGVVGSITHTRGFIAAAVAESSALQMLGIDAERVDDVGPDVAETVATVAERRDTSAELGADATALIFSAKESVYKAWYPATGRWLDFQDVTLIVSRVNSQRRTGSVCRTGEFTIVPSRDASDADRSVLGAMRGRFAIDAGLVYTVVYAASSTDRADDASSVAKSS